MTQTPEMVSFFMQDIPEIKVKDSPPEDISMREIRKKSVVTERKYEIEKKELSKNIQAFDRRPRIYTENPYSFNAVSKKAAETPTASNMVTDPIYNAVGKALGIDMAREWDLYYDKVFTISEWAKKKAGTDISKIIKVISDKSRSVPSMGAKRIDDLYIHIGLTK